MKFLIFTLMLSLFSFSAFSSEDPYGPTYKISLRKNSEKVYKVSQCIVLGKRFSAFRRERFKANHLLYDAKVYLRGGELSYALEKLTADLNEKYHEDFDAPYERIDVQDVAVFLAVSDLLGENCDDQKKIKLTSVFKREFLKSILENGLSVVVENLLSQADQKFGSREETLNRSRSLSPHASEVNLNFLMIYLSTL